jgi:hypothetical protein
MNTNTGNAWKLKTPNKKNPFSIKEHGLQKIKIGDQVGGFYKKGTKKVIANGVIKSIDRLYSPFHMAAVTLVSGEKIMTNLYKVIKEQQPFTDSKLEKMIADDEKKYGK